MEVSGNEPAPGTVADIYHCEAAGDMRAPNQDFMLPDHNSGATQVIAASEGFCLTAQTWTPPKPGDPSTVPHGVEPKVLIVGPWLVLIGGREGLWAYYTNHTEIDANGLPEHGWRRFSIAAHHNEFFGGTEQAFSAATVSGTGGDSETTGYMGATLTADGKGVIICYDRTISHAQWARHIEDHDASAMHFNTVYCFRGSPPDG
jgi:hypothetical protein